MKKLFTAFVVGACLTGSAMAGEVTESKMDRCTRVSKLAGQIMDARQNNVSMAVAVNIVKDSPGWIKVVQEAYELPRMSVKENQMNMVMDFQNKYFLNCMKYAD